ncbi:uncharacterized protein LOC124788582 [Schistocerca piceifrons]|uniref:uncharacterized protein LOC124788582 n=1 Tax=Schistocerca piceifrons TaxID=274613 RepID=UPI001F5F71CC|nr:uncharacterized protein LOC124788582 [Schistocerca piceifrons]
METDLVKTNPLMIEEPNAPTNNSYMKLRSTRGNIPELWRTSTIKMLFKGKGNQMDLNSYRGIGLEKCTLKILTSISQKRIFEEVDQKIPEEQFIFRKGRSMLHPIIFVDYTKALDKLNRCTLISKLELITGKDKLTMLIHNMLTANFIQITGNVSTSKNDSTNQRHIAMGPTKPFTFQYCLIRCCTDDKKGNGGCENLHIR